MGREEESTSPGALARKRRRSELGCKRCGEWLNSNLVLDSLERLLNAQSVYAQVDENGRIVLSPKLREISNITDKATFVGMGDKFQIWEPDNYIQDMALMNKRLSDNNLEEEIYSLLDYKENK